MPSQLGTFVQLNATGTASNLALLGLLQRLATFNQQYKATLDLALLELNNIISGATTANIETALGLITGVSNGTTLFNAVNGASQAFYGTAQNSQNVNVGAQIGGP